MFYIWCMLLLFLNTVDSICPVLYDKKVYAKEEGGREGGEEEKEGGAGGKGRGDEDEGEEEEIIVVQLEELKPACDLAPSWQASNTTTPSMLLSSPSDEC